MDIILRGVRVRPLYPPRSIGAAIDQRFGHRPIPVALPGVDDASSVDTLGDQVAAAVDAVDAADRPMVVGHSVACTLACMVADQRLDTIRTLALIGGLEPFDGRTE